MIEPGDLLQTAIDIQRVQQSEIERRTSINRAYYAVFHTAEQLAKTLALPEPPYDPKAGSHQRRFNQLISCDITRTSSRDAMLKIKAFGYTASKVLKPNRVVADYQLSISVENDLMDDTIAKSEKIISAIQ